ncbi:MAG: YwmB family TATA-box binding protein [Tepidanaerobacteraceae bacterium]|nr:YwmB family TATA-box binding protein [Tepidanaerobacteraceae bacterium]
MKFLKAIIAGIILVIFLPAITWSYEEKDPVKQAFLSSGARLEICDITDWSIIARESMDFDDMEKIKAGIIKLFDTEEQNFKTTKESDEMYRILNMDGWIDSDTFLQVILQSVDLPEEYEEEPQTYLVVTATSRNIEKLEELRIKVRDAIVSFGGQSRITTCITGTFDGKLNEAQQDGILEKFARDLKIENYEKVRDDYTASVVGYSPEISESITILKKNYNVNIAMRYNSEDDRTYIWIGTPVISVEY